MNQEEERLGRIFVSGNISEEAYKKLHAEWWEKIQNAKISLERFTKEISVQVDDLDLALSLMARMKDLYPRLKNEEKSELLKILGNKIVVNSQGVIIDHELNSPFTFLWSISTGIQEENIGVKINYADKFDNLLDYQVSPIHTTIPGELNKFNIELGVSD